MSQKDSKDQASLTTASSDDGQEQPVAPCLYYKFKPGGEAIACSHTQEVRMVLELKKAPYTLKPVLEDPLPEWLADHGLPCLAGEDGSDPRTDLRDIAAHIDATFAPQGELTERGVAAPWDNATFQKYDHTFFKSLTKFLKSTNIEKDEELLEGLTAQLALLDTHLQACGDFLAGAEPGLPDCTLAPKLRILAVAGAALKDFKVEAELPHVAAYMARLFALPAFVESQYEDQVLLKPWVSAQKRSTRRASYSLLVSAE